MEVIWTPFAKQQVLEILIYAETNFGYNTAVKLAMSIEQNDLYLANNPQIGAIEQSLKERSETFRYLMVNKVFKELYYVREETVYIMAFWNCHQNPIRMNDMLE